MYHGFIKFFFGVKMMSLQQIRRFFVTIILTIMLAITIAFDFGTTNSWAATLPTQSQTQIASMNRAKAVTKNIEGKAQEAIGNMTGDPKDQMMGKAKQVESQARNAAEDIKDQMKLKGAQEAIGKATGNRQDQVAGKAKQVESQVRNAVEDVKDTVQDILN